MVTEIITPRCTQPGSPEWLRAAAKLAKSWTSRGSKDIREVVKYVRRLKDHDWRVLIDGKDDWDLFCRETLGYAPEFITHMETGAALLDAQGHEGPITVEQAEEAVLESSTTAERVQEAARGTTGEVLGRGNPTGRNQHSEEMDESTISSSTQSQRAKESGVSLDTQKKLDRLAQERPDLLKEVREGNKSVHAAAVEAGVVKSPSLLNKAKKAFLKLTDEERKELMEWIEIGCKDEGK